MGRGEVSCGALSPSVPGAETGDRRSTRIGYPSSTMSSPLLSLVSSPKKDVGEGRPNVDRPTRGEVRRSLTEEIPDPTITSNQ